MDFDFTPSERALFERIRTAAAAAPGDTELAAGDPESAGQALRKGTATLSAAGYFDPVPAEGPPSGAVARMAAMETLAACAPTLFLGVEMSTRLLGRCLKRWGSGPRRDARLEGLRRGERIGAVALCEETMNVENDPLTTRMVRRGDRIVVGGRKSYVINAPLADWFGVVGSLEGRTAMLLLDRGSKGLVVSERLRTLGYDGLHIAGLTLTDCEVPEGNILLPPEGDDLLEPLRQWENEILTAAAVGLMQAAFEEARDFAKTHRSGGKPIIAYQEVGFKLAEMLTLCQTARLLAYRAAWIAAQHTGGDPSLLWCAKVFASEAAERVAGEALRILAGRGFRAGSAAECAYRAAKWTQIGGISTEMARVRIGDRALGYR